MDSVRFKNLYVSVIKALDEHRLYEALTLLGQMQDICGQKSITEQYQIVCRDYQLMMKYMTNGFADPERHRLFGSFIQRSYELCDTLYRSEILQQSPAFYASLWRTLHFMQNGPRTMTDLSELQGITYRQLFEIAYTSATWDSTTYEMVRNAIRDEKNSPNEICMLISAVTLGAMEFFDAAKIKLLADVLCTNKNTNCQARAIVGFVLLIYRYQQRVPVYPEIISCLDSVGEIPVFQRSISGVQLQLILSRETQKIEKDIQEEIIPEMMKQAKDAGLDKKLKSGFFHENLQEMEANPEWESQFKKSEWNKQIRRLIEMQQKGADIFMGSFRMFKQKFPFFSIAANWFYPFDEKHPEVVSILNDNPALKTFIRNAELCDSDKYSFCLMFAALPASQLSLLKKQFQTSGIDEHAVEYQRGSMDSELQITNLPQAIRVYIQDMYRFFKLYSQFTSDYDPFETDLMLTECLFLRPFFKNKDIQDIGDFAFSERLYDLSIQLYAKLPPAANNYQKIGYSYQMRGNYAKAIDAYDKANLLGSDDVWGYQHLAYCYRRTGQYDKALQYYSKIEKQNPDDCSNLVRIGECLICEGRFEEAATKLFKADYLDGVSGIALRPLAWALLAMGKIEQARTYYAKILDKAPSSSDYLNAGHAEWISGNVSQAINFYRQSLHLSKDTVATLRFFAEDAHLLEKNGITSDDISMMVDIINNRTFQV